MIALLTGLPIAAVRARGEEPAPAANPADITPPWGTFPKPGAGIELAGELVVVDHVNRRFGLRLDGDFNKYRYFADAKLKATLLPYGEVWYHGAPADLADIPLGTRLQGRFLLPPKDAPPRQLTSDQEKAFPPPLHDRALVVEDGFSHERRRGRAFRIDKLEIKRDDISYGDLKAAIERGPIVPSPPSASRPTSYGFRSGQGCPACRCGRTGGGEPGSRACGVAGCNSAVCPGSTAGHPTPR